MNQNLSGEQFPSGWAVHHVETQRLLPYTDENLAERPPGFMEELARDIRANGMREPIKPMGTSSSPVTGIWDGKHRLEVARRLGLKTVPALLTDSMRRHLVDRKSQ